MLEYHHSDSLATPETEGRYSDYGIGGVPTMAFDGNQNKVEGSYDDPALDYQAYKPIVDAERAKGSSVTLAAYRIIETM